MRLGRTVASPYADDVPAAPDGPIPSGPMPATAATSVVLRGAVVVTSGVGVVAVVVAGLVGGGPAALGAGLAAVIVIAFFASGQYAVTRILAGNPDMALSGALLVYMTQILVLFGLIVVLQGATWLDPKVFALTVVICTLTWVLMLVWGTQRIKVLYVEPRGDDHHESEVEQ